MVERNRVHLVIALFECLEIPFHISGHGNFSGTADNQLYGRIDRAHLQGGISGLEAVLRGRHVTDLPWAIHFIPKAPAFDLYGLNTVLAAQIAQRVPFATLQYSTRSAALCGVPVPRLTARSGSVWTA
jgi:hypothetical protein